MSKRNLHKGDKNEGKDKEEEETFDQKVDKWDSLTRGDWKYKDRPHHR